MKLLVTSLQEPICFSLGLVSIRSGSAFANICRMRWLTMPKTVGMLKLSALMAGLSVLALQTDLLLTWRPIRYLPPCIVFLHHSWYKILQLLWSISLVVHVRQICVISRDKWKFGNSVFQMIQKFANFWGLTSVADGIQSKSGVELVAHEVFDNPKDVEVCSHYSSFSITSC